MNIHDRQERALALRRMGKSPAEIVRQLHDLMRDTDYPLPPSYDLKSVTDDIIEASRRHLFSEEHEAFIERHLWKERWEELVWGIYPQAKAGNLEAVDCLFKIHDFMAKLIPGLQPPASRCAAPCCTLPPEEPRQPDGPVIVKIEWDEPLDNTGGWAEPGDPATDVEVTKMLIGILGREVGTEVAEAATQKLAEIAARRATSIEARGPWAHE